MLKVDVMINPEETKAIENLVVVAMSYAHDYPKSGRRFFTECTCRDGTVRSVCVELNCLFLRDLRSARTAQSYPAVTD